MSFLPEYQRSWSADGKTRWFGWSSQQRSSRWTHGTVLCHFWLWTLGWTWEKVGGRRCIFATCISCQPDAGSAWCLYWQWGCQERYDLPGTPDLLSQERFKARDLKGGVRNDLEGHDVVAIGGDRRRVKAVLAFGYLHSAVIDHLPGWIQDHCDTKQRLDLSCFTTSSTVSVGWILWLTTACVKSHDYRLEGGGGEWSPRQNLASRSPWSQRWTWWQQWWFFGSRPSRNLPRGRTRLPRREAKDLKVSSESWLMMRGCRTN